MVWTSKGLVLLSRGERLQQGVTLLSPEGKLIVGTPYPFRRVGSLRIQTSSFQSSFIIAGNETLRQWGMHK